MVTNTGTWLSKNLQPRKGVSKPQMTAMVNARDSFTHCRRHSNSSSNPRSLELPQDSLFSMAPPHSPYQGASPQNELNVTSRTAVQAGMK